MSVSFVKQAGGAAVPIFVDQPDEYYEQLIPRLNAVYLPGGSSHNLDSPYAETAMRIFRYVMYPGESHHISLNHNICDVVVFWVGVMYP